MNFLFEVYLILNRTVCKVFGHGRKYWGVHYKTGEPVFNCKRLGCHK